VRTGSSGRELRETAGAIHAATASRVPLNTGVESRVRERS